MQIFVYIRELFTVQGTLFLPLSSLHLSVSQCLMMIMASPIPIEVGAMEEASFPEGVFSNTGLALSYLCLTVR